MPNSAITQTYKIYFTNNSNNGWYFCLFQKSEDESNLPLAWFAQKVNPGTHTDFSWSIDYSFVWASTGELKPGVIFDDNQNVAADLNTSNQIFLSYNGNFTFLNQTATTPEGTLSIVQDNTIPMNQAAVGIGMSGRGTFAVQAQPNITASFTSNPTYWCTFGSSFQTGQVLDPAVFFPKNRTADFQLTNIAQVIFVPGVYTMCASVNNSNILSISAYALG